MNPYQMNIAIENAMSIAAHEMNTSGNKKNATGKNITPIIIGYAAL